MNILFLAPEPFYIDRGTPIAIDLVIKNLSERDYQIDLVTYHEGKTIEYKNVKIYRNFAIPFVKNIRAGFSWGKVFSDFFMLIKAISLVFRKRYHLTHAVEEAVFIALFLKIFFSIPYVYDMDSSLSQQLVDKYPIFAFLAPLLRFFESIAIKNSEAVIPVCDDLAKFAAQYNPKRILTLHDVSLLKDKRVTNCHNGLRSEFGIHGVIFMYVGNLEIYQGIDLLIESFALVLNKSNEACLVVIGGADSDIKKYKEKSYLLGVYDKVYFLGPKPIDSLDYYLSQADILVSPRIKGNNIPMKLYSYLDSGKVVLATDLPTHTQVLNGTVALLARPSPEEFAKGMIRLMEDKNLRIRLGLAGENLIAEKYSYESLKKRLNLLYNWLEIDIAKSNTVGTS